MAGCGRVCILLPSALNSDFPYTFIPLSVPECPFVLPSSDGLAHWRTSVPKNRRNWVFPSKFPSLGIYWNIIFTYFCLSILLKCNRLPCFPERLVFELVMVYGNSSLIFLVRCTVGILGWSISIINYSLSCVCSLGSC